jgi:hypothetical protein
MGNDPYRTVGSLGHTIDFPLSRGWDKTAAMRCFSKTQTAASARAWLWSFVDGQADTCRLRGDGEYHKSTLSRLTARICRRG